MNNVTLYSRLAGAYKELAWMNMAADLYNFYEGRCVLPPEGEAEWLFREAFRALHELLISEGAKKAEALAKLTELRKSITHKVTELSALTDQLMIPEYLLNRLEYTYRAELSARDNEQEARELLQFIFNSDDNVTVNQRIRDMVMQLPVRMTRQRFFDLICQGMAVYEDGEAATLEEFIERILGSAGLLVKNEPGAYTRWKQMADELTAMDFNDMSKEQWDDAEGRLVEVEEGMEILVGFLCELQQIINYAVCIGSLGGSDGSVEAANQYHSFVDTILSLGLTALEDGQWIPVPEDDLKVFVWMEGRLEKTSAEIARLEGILDEKGAEEELMVLRQARVLMSTSVFASLDERSTEVVTKEYLARRTEEVLARLEEGMAGKSRRYLRAMMAAVLKELPVFFNNHTEVMNYVLSSLGGCKDLAEKNASLDLLWTVYGR